MTDEDRPQWTYGAIEPSFGDRCGLLAPVVDSYWLSTTPSLSE